MLMFDQHAHSSESVSNQNLRTLFGLDRVPCDTQMRTILDQVFPSELRGAFRAIHSGLQRSNSLKQFQWLGGKLLLVIDGTSTPHRLVSVASIVASRRPNAHKIPMRDRSSIVV